LRKVLRLLSREPADPFQPYSIRKHVGGIGFDFLVGDRLGEQWYRKGNTLGQELEFTAAMVTPGDVVFEVGAHHGFTTILLAHWVGRKGKVVAFEATPHNARILKKKITRNGLQNVIVVSSAVGSAEGRVGINDDYCASIVRRGTSLRSVKMTYLDKYSHFNPDLLKLDVEGFEMEVLRGAKTILKRAPKLAIEVHVPSLPSYGCTPGDIFGLLPTGAYSFWLQPDAYTPPTPYGGGPIQGDAQVHLYAVPRWPA
jgi:FkbM family methyltransferase